MTINLIETELRNVETEGYPLRHSAEDTKYDKVLHGRWQDAMELNDDFFQLSSAKQVAEIREFATNSADEAQKLMDLHNQEYSDQS